MSVEEMTLEEFTAEATKRFGSDKKDWKFVCPRCKTVQSAADLLEAGASKDLASSYMGFSCIGRVNKKLGCDWTLGGLFRIHTLEIVTEDEHKHPLFELAEAPV